MAPDQYQVALQNKLATLTDMPDVISFNFASGLTTNDLVKYGERGLLIDLKAAMKEYDDDGSIVSFMNSFRPEAWGTMTTSDDKIYYFTYAYNGGYYDGETGEKLNGWNSNFGLSIRTDWLEKVGIEYKREWTTDELFDALLACREQDANGNGLKDEIVAIGVNNEIKWAFGVQGELLPCVRDYSDEISAAWYQDGMKEYVQFMKKLYDAELFDTSVLSGNAQNSIYENRAIVYDGYTGTGMQNNENTGDAECAYEPIVLRAADGNIYLSGDGTGSTGSITGWIPGWGITSYCEDVEAAIDLFDFVHSDEYSILCNYGVEGVSFEYNEFGYPVSTWVDGTSAKEDASLWPILACSALPGMTSIPTSFAMNPALYTETTWEYMQYIMEVTGHPENYPDVLTDTGLETLALPTQEEMDILDKHYSVLKTYSDELLVDLVLSNKSLDDWDTYIEEMRQLGLDEIIAVYQQRYDRYVAASQN